MLKIKKTKIAFNTNEDIVQFKNSIIKNTFKTNLNYHYLFYFLYAKGSDKTFVGNWINENSFWLIRKEKTFFKFRPYVVTVLDFNLVDNTLTLTTKIPPITFLSLIVVSYFLLLLMFHFIVIFTIILFPIFLIVYFLLLNDEVDNTLLSIKSFF